MSTITYASLAEIPLDIAENALGPIVPEVELEFLARIRQTAARIMVVLNKGDSLETSGRAASPNSSQIEAEHANNMFSSLGSGLWSP